MTDTIRPVDDIVVRCSFDACPAHAVELVVGAVVDQLCAAADVDITLLDAIEYPLTEALSALREHGIVGADIGVHGKVLTVTIGLTRAVDDPSALLGPSADVVSSFFDVDVDVDADADANERSARFCLSGSLT